MSGPKQEEHPPSPMKRMCHEFELKSSPKWWGYE